MGGKAHGAAADGEQGTAAAEAERGIRREVLPEARCAVDRAPAPDAPLLVPMTFGAEDIGKTVRVNVAGQWIEGTITEVDGEMVMVRGATVGGVRYSYPRHESEVERVV